MPDFRALLASRELLFFFVLRELQARYRQTIFGWSWVFLQPLLTTFVFTLVFSIIAKVPTGDIPYPVFSLSGLLLWTFFANALRRAGTSLSENGFIVRKVYFPRLIFPLSGILSCLVDFVVSLPLLIGVLLYFRVPLSPNLLWIPVFIAISFLTALGFGLWFAAIDVRYRDVAYFLPFAVQLWMYATPVAYPYALVPENLRALYNLNPMVGVIEGMRWAVIGAGRPPDLSLFYASIVVVLILVSGLIFFRRMEADFADVV